MNNEIRKMNNDKQKTNNEHGKMKNFASLIVHFSLIPGKSHVC